MKKIVYLLLFGLLFSACKDNFDSSIPNVPVNFSCNLIQAPYSLLSTSGQFLTARKTSNGYIVESPGQIPFQSSKYGFFFGYGGLAIGNSTFNGYCAYDLACPVENSSKISVELQKDGLGKVICPKCKSEYDLNNGGIPVKGVSKERLKPYRIARNGDILIITE